MTTQIKTPTPATATPGRGKSKPSNRNVIVICAIIAGLAATFFLVRGIWKNPGVAKDRSTGSFQFVSTEAFNVLAPEQKSNHAATLRDKTDDIAAAFKAGKINETEYRAAMNLAWMGKQEEHVARYFALPTAQARKDFLARLARKLAQKKTKETPADAFTHDAAYESAYTAAWPLAKREQYQEFREAYAQVRKASSTTRGTTKPAKKDTTAVK